VNIADDSRHASCDAPALSVVFAVRGGFANARKAVECLLAQTIAPRIELIVVSNDPEILRAIESFLPAGGCFSRSEFVLHAGRDLASDRIRGAREAVGGLIAFTEDHSFPAAHWAEEIVAAFGSSKHVLAAAPLLRNPNPATAIGSAHFLLNHGVNEGGRSAGRFEDCEHLPWHGTVYRRDVFLSAIGGGHVELLQAESFLQETVRRSHPAARFVRCPRTWMNHVNMSRLRPALLLAFHGGRIFGAVRADMRHWGYGIRIARSALFPLVAVLAIWRKAALLRDRSSLLRTCGRMTVAVPLAFFHALGEAVGTCFGMGESDRAFADFEYDRSRFVVPAERHILFSDATEPGFASTPTPEHQS
jgi:hypothetical protein